MKRVNKGIVRFYDECSFPKLKSSEIFSTSQSVIIYHSLYYCVDPILQTNLSTFVYRLTLISKINYQINMSTEMLPKNCKQ